MCNKKNEIWIRITFLKTPHPVHQSFPQIPALFHFDITRCSANPFKAQNNSLVTLINDLICKYNPGDIRWRLLYRSSSSQICLSELSQQHITSHCLDHGDILKLFLVRSQAALWDVHYFLSSEPNLTAIFVLVDSQRLTMNLHVS